ncbi:MAG: EAL domain-containing protein [Cyanobacteria bacterium P01_G01_bin.38]
MKSGRLNRRHPYILASFLGTVLVLILRLSGGLQSLELASFDMFVRLQPDRGPDPALLVVGITEADIQAVEEWPLSDQTVADILAKLQSYQPKAIGLDLHRSVPVDEAGAPALAEQLKADNLFAITRIGFTEEDHIPPPPGVAENRVGYNDFVIDSDNVLRRNWMFAADGDARYYSFALRLSLYALAQWGIEFEPSLNSINIGDTEFPSLRSTSGSYQGVDTLGYQVMLQYRSAEQVAQQLSVRQVLNDDFDPAWIKDKIVLIGTVAPSIKDVLYTPYSTAMRNDLQMPGVLIHAQMVSQILNAVLHQRPLMWFWTQWQEYLWIAFWAVVGSGLAWWLKRPIWLWGAIMGSLGLIVGISWLVFLQAGWIPLVPPVIAVIATVANIMVYRFFFESFYDPLTGLPNRTFFLKKLQTQLNDKPGQSQTLSLLFLDVNDFKTINETFGHKFGDKLLISLANRIKGCLPTDMVARVGDDEFAVMLRKVDQSQQAIEVADQLQDILTKPIYLNHQPLVITLSMGIAFHQRGFKYQAESLLQDAHRAMYRAKALGKDRYEVFVKGMRSQAISRLQLEMDLRQALDQQQFMLYYQPIVALKTGKIAGFEALIRWQHAERGFVSPAEFIPVAEETGLIIPIGRWILQEACRQIHVWHQTFAQTPPLFVSVNLSSRQFAQADLVEQVETIIIDTGLERRCLKLELTESAAMEDVDIAIEQLLRLKVMDVQISLDDFGTGYSSLSYLHRFPTDTLKVDQSFVGRMEQTSEDSDIVSTIIALGHKLKMNIVAEGIETAEHLAQLRALDCDYGQGYFFSKPLSGEEIEIMLERSPVW